MHAGADGIGRRLGLLSQRRVPGARDAASSQPARPTANIPTPASTAWIGSVTTSSRQPSSPATLRSRGQRRCPPRLGEGRGVRDGVVDEDAERREADGSAQVGGQHQQADRHGQRQLRVVGHPIARMDRGQPARQVGVARHRQRGASDAGDQGQQRAEARHRGPGLHDGQRPGGAHGLHCRGERPRAAGQRLGARGCQRRDPDREVDHHRDTQRDGMARGMVRSGSRTSSPSVAIRA